MKKLNEFIFIESFIIDVTITNTKVVENSCLQKNTKLFEIQSSEILQQNQYKYYPKYLFISLRISIFL